MRRICVWTNAHEACGNAQYGRELAYSLRAWYEVTETHSLDQTLASGAELVLVNWHPARVICSPDAVKSMHARNMRVIIIIQNSFVGNYDATEGDPVYWADAAVSHQQMTSNQRIITIPVGIPEVDGLSETTGLKVGVAGFPYAWKRFDMAAEVGQMIGGRGVIIAPLHDMGDVHTSINIIRDAFPGVEIIRELLPVTDVVRILSSCKINIFFFQHLAGDDLVGQSGSVRMGVAARRPMIISDHPKLSSLFDYPDEFYIAQDQGQVYEFAKEIVAREQAGLPVKRPNKIIQDSGWHKTSDMYRELIEELLA